MRDATRAPALFAAIAARAGVTATRACQADPSWRQSQSAGRRLALYGVMMPMGESIMVLVVEDHVDTLEVFRIVLGEWFCVVGCASASEALRVLRTVRPDVVMLDIGMTPVDGLECLEAIRSMPGYEGLPAVAVTAHAREADRRRFLAAGFQVVVTKPVLDAEGLIAAVTTALDTASSPLTGSRERSILSRRGSARVSTAGAA